MGLPQKLKNYNLYNDGESYIGVIEEFTQPTIALAMEEWRGGGMLGPVKVDMGVQLMEAEWTNGGMVRQVLRQFGISRVDGVLLRLVGAYRAHHGRGVHPVEITIRKEKE